MGCSKQVRLLAAAACVLAAATLHAQNIAGSITGVVQDPQGAVVPAAKVTLTNEAQGGGSARVVTTTGEGTFLFSPVLAGKYTITIDVPGFKKYVQSGITLDVSDRLGLPPTRALRRRGRAQHDARGPAVGAVRQRRGDEAS